MGRLGLTYYLGKSTDVTFAKGPQYFSPIIAPSGIEESTRSASSRASLTCPDQVRGDPTVNLLTLQEYFSRAVDSTRQYMSGLRILACRLPSGAHRTSGPPRCRFCNGSYADLIGLHGATWKTARHVRCGSWYTAQYCPAQSFRRPSMVTLRKGTAWSFSRSTYLSELTSFSFPRHPG